MESRVAETDDVFGLRLGRRTLSLTGSNRSIELASCFIERSLHATRLRVTVMVRTLGFGRRGGSCFRSTTLEFVYDDATALDNEPRPTILMHAEYPITIAVTTDMGRPVQVDLRHVGNLKVCDCGFSMRGNWDCEFCSGTHYLVSFEEDEEELQIARHESGMEKAWPHELHESDSVDPLFENEWGDYADGYPY